MSLIRALGLYARILGKKLGVNVVFKKVSTAATDGNTVFIDPAFDSIGTPSDAATVFGLIGHECMHLRLTDFEELKRFLEEVKNSQKGNPHIIKHLQNIIEDVWGEREFCEVYPSVWVDICHSMVEMRKDDLYGPPGNKLRPNYPAELFVNWFLAQCLGSHYRSLTAFSEDAIAWQAAARSSLGDAVVDKTLALIPEIDGVASTKEACSLALRVYEVIEEVAKSQKESSEKEKASKTPGNPDKPGSPGSPGKAGNAGKPDDQPSQGGQGTPSETTPPAGSGDPKPGEGKSQGDSSQPGQPGKAPSGSSDASGQGAGSSVLDQVINAPEHHLQACNSEKGDTLKKKQEKDAVNLGPTSIAGGTTLIPSLLSPATDQQRQSQATLRALLSGRLEHLLLANADCNHEYRRNGGRIANSRLSLVKTGVLDVFDRVSLGEELDTAVMVLIDGSGSMASIWEQTLAAAYAVMDVLAEHLIPIGMLQFGRDLSMVHPLDATWRSNAAMRPNMVGGGTPTAVALMEAAKTLLDRTESRKVILVITDGVPHKPVEAVAIANEIQHAGMEVIHIFLGKSGENYQMLLNHAKVGYQAVCEDHTDSVQLAKAIESAMADCFTEYLKRAA